MQAAMRAAAVSTLTAYAADVGIELQVYPGRPRTLRPPAAFVDGLVEPQIVYTAGLRQRTVQAEIVVVHGLFDSAEIAAQKDAFVDGFVDWITDHRHEAGSATLATITSAVDVPNYVPDWMAEDEQVAYYATRLVFEGSSLDGN
jgi:hypothetical protein